VNKLFYGPRDWLVSHSDARLRGALGFWMGISFVILTILTWTDPDNPTITRVLLVINLLLLVWTIVSTETPVQEEEE
jgi:hypothetical protein